MSFSKKSKKSNKNQRYLKSLNTSCREQTPNFFIHQGKKRFWENENITIISFSGNLRIKKLLSFILKYLFEANNKMGKNVIDRCLDFSGLN